MGCGTSTHLGEKFRFLTRTTEVTCSGPVGVAEQKGFEPSKQLIDQNDYQNEAMQHADEICDASKVHESARRVDYSAGKDGPDEMTNITRFSIEDCEAEAQDSSSLLQSLGGHESLVCIIDMFYEKVLGDHRLVGFFQDCNVDLLKSHVVAFVSLILDGVPNYHQSFNVESMALAHGHLIQGSGLKAEHFDMFLSHLEATFVTQNKVVNISESEHVLSEIFKILRPLRKAFESSIWNQLE
ncbi:hypothetical protein CEUSTIGMA_g2035.t1 [Chlamydomonas eustigma]|uniref:Globin family profile domain-containing protein n=1 Tax=Chlamydomonas eustigma TaxID=1157962 RepID=A0A250WUT4_9CHLO|nr:hypothetical protein CEUSTIGMA_g2035.t1 [Chlamydomonas eustigma]|eukprot:GAX74587.1 hypothetical protein CEUSTIGMA_g2035.t1 [Chlamydomonas eustigma]